MKKLFFTFLGCASLFALSITGAKAQTYKTALGLGLDFGDGTTLVGPSVKHFFSRHGAGQAEVLFGSHLTTINAFYQYNDDIKGAKGLQWYAGGGPSLNFFSYGGYSNTTFALKPMAGLDYKIAGAPLNIAFDWRPTIYLGDNDSDFAAGRFGLGFRFTF
ncbi:hypothetical protein [Pedobacter nototheniae]|uniref:hypothetical protein n=1 Tax=Pedobacter nototheniae TaxID=2488994 RepID=UPI00103AD16A|nr:MULTISPECIES: hypothetical protein [Pedobacter]